MHIVPIASGKGGVGKTLVSANVAIALAQAGKQVVLADLDLGGSNLHLVLGMTSGAPSIGGFLGKKKIDLPLSFSACTAMALRARARGPAVTASKVSRLTP